MMSLPDLIRRKANRYHSRSLSVIAPAFVGRLSAKPLEIVWNVYEAWASDPDFSDSSSSNYMQTTTGAGRGP